MTLTATHARRRMELSIRYRIRTEQQKDQCPRPIMITLRMDGRKISDYNSGVKVRPPKWSQDDQMVTGRNKSADEINERLAQIELQHRDILRELKRRYMRGEGPRPTPELVKAEFLKPGSSSPTLDALYSNYLNHLDTFIGTEDERSEKTLTRAYKTLDHVRKFSAGSSPQLIDLTTGWGKRFHVWLQVHPDTGARRMQKDTANKYLAHVRDALDYAIDEGFLPTNPLDKFRPKRGKGKPVYFMESVHLDKLNDIVTADEQYDHVLWWTRLMVYTGLDYKDAILYARGRDKYEQMTTAGVKIVITRSKPPRNVCEIPLVVQVDSLFAVYPAGPPAPVLADINRHLKLIQKEVGFSEKLTSKILRKSAGAFFLRRGHALEAVSKFLGHSSTRTTEQHYLKITSEYVNLDMKRVADRHKEK